MRKKLPIIFMVSIFLIGLGIMLYPVISNFYIEHKQSTVINNYEKVIENTSNEELKAEIERAQKYNELLTGNVIITDPFDLEAQKKLKEDTDYFNIINLAGDGIMGYISIPKINVKLPIYHGTSEEVLQKGVGHLENTSLPIGGEGSHSVLSGHTGLSTAKLFTDLNKVEEGNIFYMEVLGEKLAYKVDQIKIVEPHDTSDLVINSTEDYVTLVTCTPYGVNSHRLLVRGVRVPYTEQIEKEIEKEQSDKVRSTWLTEYFKALTIGLSVLGVILIIFIIFIVIRKKISRKKNLKGEK